jgi:adhesin/invasin
VTISPPSGVSAPGAAASFGINLSPTAASTAGGKSALIQVTDTASKNPPQYFIVAADVAAATAAAEPDPSPAGLFFTAAAGTASQVNQQQISVGTNSAASVPFFVSTSTDDGAPWLNAVASSATTSQAGPAQIAVMLSTASLNAGLYSGHVNISIGGVVRSVAVGLLLTSGSGSIAQFDKGLLVARAATCTPSSVVIAQSGLIDNFSIPTGWPAQLLATVLDNCANPLTNASVVASFSNGDPPISLTGDQTGAYSATWQPGSSSSGMSITLDANSATLQTAEIRIAGSVNANTLPVPTLATGGVLNNLNPKLGAPLAPGTVSQIYGSNIATAPDSPTAVPLPAALGGVEVLIGGMNAPLFYISPGQLNVEIPVELPANRTYPTVLVAGGQYSVPQNFDLVPVNPGTVAFSDGTLVAQHADYTLVSSSHPASPGEPLTIYLVGMGATNPSVQSGTAAPSAPLATVPSKIVVTVDGQPASVTFAGLTPGGVGLYQINFAVPAIARTGTLPVVITQDGVPANPTKLIVAAH